jgi:hypothetical protein
MRRGYFRKSLFSANEIAFLTVPLLFVASLWVIPSRYMWSRMPPTRRGVPTKAIGIDPSSGE